MAENRGFAPTQDASPPRGGLEKPKAHEACGGIAQHTPGPWILSPGWQPDHSAVVDTQNVYGPPHVGVVAHVVMSAQDSDRSKEREGNARLVAASPAMLKALRKICEPITVTGPADVVSACQDLHELICEIAQEAIQEAAGERR